MNTLRFTLALLIVLTFSNITRADTLYWTGEGFDNLVSNDENWDVVVDSNTPNNIILENPSPRPIAIYDLASGEAGVISISNGMSSTQSGASMFLNIAQDFLVGNWGAGSFSQNGAEINIDKMLIVGNDPGSTGNYTLLDGVLTVNLAPDRNETFIGNNGVGYFTQSGGYFDASRSAMYLGNTSSAYGKFTMLAGDGEAVFNGAALGEWGGTGEILQQGGTMSFINPSTTACLFLGRQISPIRATGIYTLEAGALYADYIELGHIADGTFTQTGGTNTVTWDLNIAQLKEGIGVYNLSGTGELTTGRNLNIGIQGQGTVNQDSPDSILTVAEGLILGGDALFDPVTPANSYRSNGTYQLDNGIIESQWLHIGVLGDGYFTQTGGWNFSGNLWMGCVKEDAKQAQGYGSYHLSGDSDTWLYIYNGATIGGEGNADFTQDGGVFTVDGDLRIAEHAGSTSTYQMLGPSELYVGGFTRIGDAGTAVFTQNEEFSNFWTSGQLSINNLSTFNHQDGYTVAGSFVNDGKFLMDDGVLTVGSGMSSPVFTGPGPYIPAASDIINNGAFTMTGGEVKGSIENNGTFKVTNMDNAVFAYDFTNNNKFESDPSTVTFNNLIVGEDGYLAGGADDEFHIQGNFWNNSTNSAEWSTELSTLVFDDNALGHAFVLNASDEGPIAAAYTQNFAWDTVNFGNEIVNISILSSEQGALYLNTILGLDLSGLTVTNLLGDGRIYYMPGAGGDLSGGIYTFGTSGRLIPIGTVPEPLSATLFLFGGALIARRLVRRRKNG